MTQRDSKAPLWQVGGYPFVSYLIAPPPLTILCTIFFCLKRPQQRAPKEGGLEFFGEYLWKGETLPIF